MADNRGDERSQSERDYAKSVEEGIRDRVCAGIHRRERARHRPPAAGIVIGTLIIAVGVLLFLDNLGLFHIYNLWRLWPVVLIALGLSKLFESRGSGGRLWAGMAMAFGVLFLLGNLGVWQVRWNLMWPLALVGIGASMLLHALDRKDLPGRMPRPEGSVNTSAADTLKEWATFSGIKRRLDTQNFQGGEMIAVFGGIDVDLRRANVASPGEEVVIDANATFGGIEIRVPDTWQVVMRGMGIFGGYEDKTVPPRLAEGQTPTRLLVTGYAIFGGVSIEN